MGGICRRLSPDPLGLPGTRGAKAGLKSLIPEDAKEAIGHGVRAKRSRSGAVSFDLMDVEASHASLQ